MPRADRPTAFETRLACRRALEAAEAAGEVADSHAVRLALLARMHAGELTLEQVQTELKSIQRKAKREGRPVRDDFFKRGRR